MISRNQKNKTKNILVILLAVLMLFVTFVSYQIIVEKAHHECTGENCSICIQLEEAVSYLKSIKYVPILSFLATILCIVTKWVPHKVPDVCVSRTLISLKVEMLN